MLILRGLTSSDLDAVVSIEKATYPEVLLEGKEEFAEKLTAFNEGALGFFDDGVLVAYMFCHPWTIGKIFELGSGLPKIPENPNCMYIHDLAVDRSHRGKGLAPILLNEAHQIAKSHRLEYSALVAVLGSVKFWEHQGYTAHHQLAYRPGIWATYMVKRLK
jgi:GNAT superfamily N-acetyltransferase